MTTQAKPELVTWRDGRLAPFIGEILDRLADLGDGTAFCTYCKGTGQREPRTWRGRTVCHRCRGTGKVHVPDAVVEKINGNLRTTRLIMADWIEEHWSEEIPGEMSASRDFVLSDLSALRDDSGSWTIKGEQLIWCILVPYNHDPGGGIKLEIEMTHKNWVYHFPSDEWLRSGRCRALVRSWLRPGTLDLHYDWARDIAVRAGWVMTATMELTEEGERFFRDLAELPRRNG